MVCVNQAPPPLQYQALSVYLNSFNTGLDKFIWIYRPTLALGVPRGVPVLPSELHLGVPDRTERRVDIGKAVQIETS